MTLQINCARSGQQEFQWDLPCLYQVGRVPTAPLVTAAIHKKAPRQYRQFHKHISKPVSLPLDTVKAGDHCDLRISRQILPLLFMFGWYIFVVKAIWNKK